MTAAVYVCSVEALAAPAKPARKLVNVADTRALDPGVTRWIADLYNSSYWLFGLFTVALMALMGLALGYACDRAMGLLGIHLGRMEHHE
jgi:hypothetical protein